MNYRGRERKEAGVWGAKPPSGIFRGGEGRQGMTADIAAEVAEGGRGAAAAVFHPRTLRADGADRDS